MEMLERSNLVAVVGGGQSPKFPDRNGECETSLWVCVETNETSSDGGCVFRPAVMIVVCSD